MSSNVPSDIFYTREHEWVKVDGSIARVGITDFAQSSLGDIVYLELPETGQKLSKMQSFGVVESVKSVSDLYAPIEGVVKDVNSALVDGPEQINQDPYNNWLIELEVSSEPQKDLMNASDYTEYLSTLGQ